jgi:hypothetical protein
MIFSQDRDQMRRYFTEVLRKHHERRPLEPLEDLVASVLVEHPEYHAALEGEGALARDYLPEMGETNPFLHMGMHIALREQIAADRPPGIRALHATLAARFGSAHEAEHRMMECLGEALWRAQRRGLPPDEADYLDCLRRVSSEF